MKKFNPAKDKLSVPSQLFKAWKQAINVKQVFNTVNNYDHQWALIYAALIFQLITLNVAASLKLGGRVLSLENFSKKNSSPIVREYRS